MRSSLDDVCYRRARYPQASRLSQLLHSQTKIEHINLTSLGAHSIQ